MIAYLCRVSSSITTAATVVSEPVPAVVGIANSGGMRFHTRRMPPICSHVRFGHVVKEPEGGCECGFPAYIQSVREHMNAIVAAKLAEMGATDDLFGGEVVVVGSGSPADATIDEPVDYAPEQLVESLVKPFEPDVVVCGDSGKSKLRSFLRGNAGDYLARKLDCEVVRVASA